MLIKSEQSDKSSVELEWKGGGERYRITLSGCLDPVCHCRSIDVELRRQLDDGGWEDEPDHVVSVDYGAHEVEALSTVDDSDFETQFVDELSAEDFKTLEDMHLVMRAESTEATPSEEIFYPFNFPMIEGSGELVRYNEVLRYSEYLHVQLDQQEHLIRDYYCLNPGCNCTEITIALFSLEQSEIEPVCSCRVNYSKNRFMKIGREGCFTTIEKLRGAVLKQYPDFYAKLQQRHTRMREIYKNSREQSQAQAGGLPALHNSQPMRRGEGRVGRNEPCPCGSGKKYKKCCLRK